MFEKTYMMRTIIVFICFCIPGMEGTYIERFSTIDNGNIAFTGNTVGLSKATGENNPGTNDSIGAYISINPSLQVGQYPPGTTLSVSENGSAAVLDLPPSSEVLYAELVWSGSYGWPLDNPSTPPPADCQVTFTTPQKITHLIKADKATAQNDLTPGFAHSGNYVRSANVTTLVQLGGKGTYAAGQIPGTIDKTDEEHNAAGWTLAVVYRNPKMHTSKMTLWVGCEQGKNSQVFHLAEGFCMALVGRARLFISAIEGDAVRAGDHLLFGSHTDLHYPFNALSGTNNLIDNFFGSQINTFIEMKKDDDGKLIYVGDGQLDTRGTFGTLNQDALHHENHVGARQGYDITSIDLKDRMWIHQTQAYIQGQTLEGDEDYTINVLALQVQMEAPIIWATKSVNGGDLIPAPKEGQILHFQIEISNDGMECQAKKVRIYNLVQSGLNFVPGSLKMNNAALPDSDIQSIPIGDLQFAQVVIIEYQATVNSQFLNGPLKIKSSKIDYQFRSNPEDDPIVLTSTTNPVLIQ